MNLTAKATDSIAKPTNSIANGTNSIAKPMNSIANGTNSIANGTNSIAKATNSIANGTNSIAKSPNSIAKTCKRVKELSLRLPSSHNDVQKAITQLYIVLSTFAWCHITPHVMAIQLIYRYHVITSPSDKHNDDTNVEGRTMIQRVVVGEFLVCMLKVYIQADSFLFANY